MEAWEKSDRKISDNSLVDTHQEEFIKSTGDQVEETPYFDYWFGSGPYNGRVDIERRFGLGEE